MSRYRIVCKWLEDGDLRRKTWGIEANKTRFDGDFWVVKNRAMMAECGKNGQFCKEKRAVTSS